MGGECGRGNVGGAMWEEKSALQRGSKVISIQMKVGYSTIDTSTDLTIILTELPWRSSADKLAAPSGGRPIFNLNDNTVVTVVTIET